MQCSNCQAVSNPEPFKPMLVGGLLGAAPGIGLMIFAFSSGGYIVVLFPLLFLLSIASAVIGGFVGRVIWRFIRSGR